MKDTARFGASQTDARIDHVASVMPRVQMNDALRVYGFDTGFVAYHRSWSPLRRDDYGPLWEHLVLDELYAARQRRDVQYWRIATFAR